MGDQHVGPGRRPCRGSLGISVMTPLQDAAAQRSTAALAMMLAACRVSGLAHQEAPVRSVTMPSANTVLCHAPDVGLVVPVLRGLRAGRLLRHEHGDVARPRHAHEVGLAHAQAPRLGACLVVAPCQPPQLHLTRNAGGRVN